MNWGILATGTIANKFATTVNAMAAEGERLAAVGSAGPKVPKPLRRSTTFRTGTPAMKSLPPIPP